jgi:excisionase family DNA binding protein
MDEHAAAHPRPTQVNMKQAAEMLNVSPMTVTRMVRAGTLRLNACGLIPITQIDAALQARSA